MNQNESSKNKQFDKILKECSHFANIKGQFTVAIAGFPAMGKSDFAQHLQKTWGDDNALVLPTEAVIYTRERRIKQKLSGCSKEAYNVDRYVKYIESLKKGEPIEVREYCHEIGAHKAKKKTLCLSGFRRLILVGPITCIKEIADLSNCVLFFQPKDEEYWLKRAIERDSKERYASLRTAVKNNKKKYQDIRSVGLNSGDSITYSVITSFIEYPRTDSVSYRYEIKRDFAPDLLPENPDWGSIELNT